MYMYMHMHMYMRVGAVTTPKTCNTPLPSECEPKYNSTCCPTRPDDMVACEVWSLYEFILRLHESGAALQTEFGDGIVHFKTRREDVLLSSLCRVSCCHHD